MKTKAFSVTGTSAWAWDGPTNVIFYESGDEATGLTARIRVRSPDGNALDAEMKPGRQLSLPTPVAGVVIESLTGNAITGKVSLGLGDIRDSSLLGTVEVVDGELRKSRAGTAFMCSAAVPPVAGNMPFLSLACPSGGTKRVIVSDIVFSSGANAAYALSRGVHGSLTGYTKAHSKLSGGAQSDAVYTSYSNAAAIGSALELALCAGSQPFVRTFKQPLVLEPGNAIHVRANTLGNDMYASIQFTEEAIG